MSEAGATLSRMVDETLQEVVLVVEDDADLRETVQEAIAEGGVRAEGAANGRRAVELLQGGLRPCLIVLDLMMPVMSGWDFLSWLEGQPEPLCSIPVLIVSAAATDKVDVARAIHPPVETLQKPVPLPVLLDAVDRYC